MIRVTFTENLQRHARLPPVEVAGTTVREVLDAVFALHPNGRGYVLDEIGALRQHMLIFVNGNFLIDRLSLSDPVPDGGEIYVMQALSGG
jgi:hypothetical protein